MSLGKRKRDTQVVSRTTAAPHPHESHAQDSVDSTDIFRRHFEAAFAPLPDKTDDKEEADSEESSEELSEYSHAESEVSEWSGLSESGNDSPVVEVIDHTVAQNGEDDEFHRARQKAFMSSKPPRDIQLQATNKFVQGKAPDEDDPTEKLNLKHDLDLQRLLRESHLLEKSKTSSKPGKERQQALDMRLQALGAKQSLFTQQKMPAAHRVGIAKKADQIETRRRREAKENGVILEKASLKKKGSDASARRQRGVDVPGVGKFSGGTLKLSRRDVASIQGPPSGASGRKGKRR